MTLPPRQRAGAVTAGTVAPAGATFTAMPLRIQGFGTTPVRAFARLPL